MEALALDFQWGLDASGVTGDGQGQCPIHREVGTSWLECRASGTQEEARLVDPAGFGKTPSDCRHSDSDGGREKWEDLGWVPDAQLTGDAVS